MEFMVVGVMPTQATLPANIAAAARGTLFISMSGGRFMAGTRQRWKATQCGEGGGLVLFVQDNTQQHTEMLRGAIDSTDGRISEIPRRYKCISNTNTEKSRQTEKTRSENNQFVIQVRIQSNF